MDTVFSKVCEFIVKYFKCAFFTVCQSVQYFTKISGK